MPTYYGYGYGSGRQREATCQVLPRWSTSRGGCRFAPGHAGDCKPASATRRQRPSWPLPVRAKKGKVKRGRVTV